MQNSGLAKGSVTRYSTFRETTRRRLENHRLSLSRGNKEPLDSLGHGLLPAGESLLL